MEITWFMDYIKQPFAAKKVYRFNMGKQVILILLIECMLAARDKWLQLKILIENDGTEAVLLERTVSISPIGNPSYRC